MAANRGRSPLIDANKETKQHYNENENHYFTRLSNHYS